LAILLELPFVWALVSSRERTSWLSAEEDTPSFSAAREKFRASATAINARSWPKSLVVG
jgi:hypothetical protein